eukprot:3078259-Rhodomonas_salina.1
MRTPNPIQKNSAAKKSTAFQMSDMYAARAPTRRALVPDAASHMLKAESSPVLGRLSTVYSLLRQPTTLQPSSS